MKDLNILFVDSNYDPVIIEVIRLAVIVILPVRTLVKKLLFGSVYSLLLINGNFS